MKLIIIEQDEYTDRVLLIAEPGDSPEELENTKAILEKKAVKN